MRKLYFCIGCRQIHYDYDYSEEDGDLEISNWQHILDSIENIKRLKEIEA